MGFLDQLSPGQKQALMVGAPVVAVFALISSRSKKAATPAPASSTSSTDSTTAGSPPIFVGSGGAPSTDAIGAGQLAEWESSLASSLQSQLAQQAASNQAPASTSQAPSPSQQPTCTPPFPWHMVGGVLIDNYSGRPAYYGAQSQPGGGWTPGTPVPGGMTTWQMPDGRWCAYNPSNWNYADASRPPVCH